MKCKLNFYILFTRKSVSKGLTSNLIIGTSSGNTDVSWDHLLITIILISSLQVCCYDSTAGIQNSKTCRPQTLSCMSKTIATLSPVS